MVPVAEDPLEALRDEFADVEKSADELRDEARTAALEEAAELVSREHRDELWASQFTLIELLMFAYREERDTERLVST